MIISVIIPSKNGIQHLRECLPTVVSAARSCRHTVNITVVDDCSDTGIRESLAKDFPGVNFLRTTPERKGACAARNIGVAASACDWISFLDNDVFVDPDFFNKAAKYLTGDIFCLTCAGYTAFPKQPGALEQLDGLKLLEWRKGCFRFTSNIMNKDLKPAEKYYAYGAQGAYFFCRRKNFDELGGYDEKIFSPYLLEETDLIYRGLKRGWKIGYAPDTEPRHKCGGTIQSKTNPYTKFLSKRNRVLFVWKNATDKKLIAYSIIWLLLSLNIKVILSCLKMINEVKAARKREQPLAKVSDTDLLKASEKTKLCHLHNP